MKKLAEFRGVITKGALDVYPTWKLFENFAAKDLESGCIDTDFK